MDQRRDVLLFHRSGRRGAFQSFEHGRKFKAQFLKAGQNRL